MHIINLVKKLFISVSSAIAYLSLPPLVLAQDVAVATVNPCNGIPTGIAKILCDLGGTNGGNIGNTIQGVVVFFIILAVVIALLYLLYGGVKWITSRGEKAEVESARNHIMAAIIGLVVVILAVFILTIILAAFGISASDLVIPKIGTGST